jgi:UPF0176 protein
MPNILNIAAYQFAELKDLTTLRARLRELTKTLYLNGTILLSPEGINLFIAGDQENVRTLLSELRQIPGLENLTPKESLSDHNPFSRMLVKIKKEIIAFGVPGIEPGKYTSKRVAPAELKKWLDEGKNITLVDTRNRYEVAAGAFQNAVTLPLDDFRNFPEVVKTLPNDLKQRTIVTYCTGGIRCEKAAPYLEREGFTDVYQLDGGILKYFEECDGVHYQGECFVFDKRVAVDPQLAESPLGMCYNCQAILTPDDQKSPHYRHGKFCPHCYKPAEFKLAQRNAQIAKAVETLPGSEPYDHVRPITVPLQFDRMNVLEFLESMRLHLSPEQWITACREGRLTRRDDPVTPETKLRSGDHLLHHVPATTEPPVNADIRVLYEDDALVVVNKPAPLPIHSCGRFHRNTLIYILNLVYAPLKLRPVHRLDSDTSGIQILAKTSTAARLVQPQFEQGRVRKSYLAKIHGHPPANHFECKLPIAREHGPGGIRVTSEDGDEAHTEFRVLDRLAGNTTLVEAIPHTGRTNQIRLHLWSLGFPIVGDPIYLPSRQLGELQSTALGAPPLCLQASSIELTHPFTMQPQQWLAPEPAWVSSPK